VLLQKSGCGNIKKTAAIIRECSRIYQYFANEKEIQNTVFPQGTENIFTWPVPATRISTYFHDPEYSSIYGSQHDAIDVPIAQ
jgi:hypothetical protein